MPRIQCGKVLSCPRLQAQGSDWGEGVSSSHLPRIVNVLLVAGGIAGVFVVLAARLEPRSLLLALFVTCVPIVLGIASDRRRQRHAESQRRELVEAQVAKFTVSEQIGTLTLGSTRFGWLSAFFFLCIGFGSMFISMLGTGVDATVLLVGGVGITVLGGFIVWRLSGIAGRPSLRLDSTGFETQDHGRFDWKQVAGIHLRETDSRGLKTCVLQMLLSAPDKAAGKDRIVHVPLPGRSAEPEAVYATALRFWTQATGYDHPWMPGIPLETVQAMMRIKRRGKRWERRVEDDSLPELSGFMRYVEANKQDLDIVAHELRRRQSTRIRDVLLALAVLALLLSVVWWTSH